MHHAASRYFGVSDRMPRWFASCRPGKNPYTELLATSTESAVGSLQCAAQARRLEHDDGRTRAMSLSHVLMSGTAS